MKIGIGNWNESVPDVLTEIAGLLGCLTLTALMALGFLLVHTLHPR